MEKPSSASSSPVTTDRPVNLQTPSSQHPAPPRTTIRHRTDVPWKEVLGVLLCAVILSIIAYLVVKYLQPASQREISLVSAAAGVLGLLSGCLYLWYKREARTALAEVKTWRIVFTLAAVLLLAYLSIELATEQKFTIKPPVSVGVLFAIVLACITVIGFILTVSRLEEIHGRILDYGHLMDRCAEALEKEQHYVKRKKQGMVFMMLNAAGFGNISAPREWERFKELLEDLATEKRVELELACLSWARDGNGTSRHDEFYHTHFSGAPDLSQRIHESRLLLRRIATANDPKHDEVIPKNLWQIVKDIPEVPFHLLLTSQKAILFITLSFPQLTTEGETSNGGKAKARGLRNARGKVPVIGFETSDSAIRAALERGFLDRLPRIAERVEDPWNDQDLP